MNIVKYRDQRPSLFNLFFDDNTAKDNFLNEGRMHRSTRPAANIQEFSDQFLIELAIPGMNKKDFNLELNKDLIKISATKSTEANESEGRFTRKEFWTSSFERSFTLPDTVLSDKISAQYEDGILKVTLPKREEAKVQPARQIKVG